MIRYADPSYMLSGITNIGKSHDLDTTGLPCRKFCKRQFQVKDFSVMIIRNFQKAHFGIMKAGILVIALQIDYILMNGTV